MSTPPEPLARLLAELAEPDAYSHPTRDIRVVQTASSAVFLTGDYAYKIKKPVDFGFLDYSTLDQRHRLCERELALNRRLCPDLYLDVVPIVEQEGRLRVGGAGEPVEWAVRMRQIPEGDMLPERLTAGTVTPAEMEGLARLLEEFHARAATGPEIRKYGMPEAIAGNIEESFAKTQERVGAELTAAHLEAVRGFLGGFLRAGAPLFRRRAEADRVRDGHGDLRAQNIALHDGIQVFDCIEFNDRFRCEDVANEIAYLAMDLDLAGRADLRAAFVEAYKIASSDAELAEVFPFYRCDRAYIRGEIALFALDEPEIPEGERQESREMAAAAFDLARSYARWPARPSLWITVGVSGSGKSVVAHELARRLPAVLLSSDATRKQLAGVAPTDRLGEEWYSAARHAEVYAGLRRRASEWLARGEHVLLDATFLAAGARRAAAEVARQAGAEFWILECRCPDAAIRERLLGREASGSDASDAGIAVYEAQLRQYEPVTAASSVDAATGHVSIETDQEPASLARRALASWWAPRDSSQEEPRRRVRRPRRSG